MALLLLPYVYGGLKAGDVKLLAAIGSFVGPAETLRSLLLTVLCYPLLALLVVLKERKLRITLLRFGKALASLLGYFAPSLKLYAARFEARDDSQTASARAPFGVALAAGTLLALYTKLLR
jgi:prepilin peptidase CpaA